jgi:pilus assembly protein Flp/PilA
MMNSIKRFVREEEGVTMVEYGLLAALISVVCIVAIQLIGTQLDLVFDRIGLCLTPPYTC